MKTVKTIVVAATQRKAKNAQMAHHVQELLKNFQIVCHTITRVHKAEALSSPIDDIREIWIAPVRSEISYATALHEIGQIKGRYQSSRRCVVREKWAWSWARQNALFWSDRMQQRSERCMAYYLANEQEFDARWRPREELFEQSDFEFLGIS